MANCGGKKIIVNRFKGEATIRYGCLQDARRAEQRLNNYKLYGHAITARIDSLEPPTDSSDTSDEPQIIEEMSRARDKRDHRTSTSSNGCEELLNFCTLHCDRKSGDANSVLPSVHIPLPLLAKRVHRLLDTHGGSVPLKSFVDCYAFEFNEVFNENDQPLLALDHLITCVPGVCVYTAPNTLVKRITWIPNRDRFLSEDSALSEPIGRRGNDHWYNSQLTHFGKEVKELLKSHAHATIPFPKFVPSYHSHFVRQLCVGHYGCLKLSELLDEIPHIVQVYGENDQRMITLTHREQTKRFATDLIKVLKAQDGRKIKLSDFSQAYQKIFERPFDISDYGVCYFDDILRDVWEGTVNITPFGSTGDKWLELPKRDRTPEQKRRTALFAQEIVELLKHSKEIIDFQVIFSKFIPCYHRFFNKQCRVNEFGFTKLIELLEELCPSVIEINADQKFGEKQLRLNYEKRTKALTYRLESILRHFDTRTTTVQRLEQEYQRIFKHKIQYSEYCAKDLVDLIDRIEPNKMRVVKSSGDLKVILVDTHHMMAAARRVVRVLMEEANGQLSISQLEERYSRQYGETLERHVLDGTFREIFVVDSNNNNIRLTEMMRFCRDCIECMQRYHKKFTVEELDREHQHRYSRPLPQPTYFKCKSMCELFGKFLDFFRIEKKKITGKAICHLSLDPQFFKRPLLVRSPVTILKRPDPKGPGIDDLLLNGNPDLPLPDLVPGHQSDAQTEDLIVLSSSSSSMSDMINFEDIEDDDTISDLPLGVRSDSPTISVSGSDTSRMTSLSEPVANGQVKTRINGFPKRKTRIAANFY